MAQSEGAKQQEMSYMHKLQIVQCLLKVYDPFVHVLNQQSRLAIALHQKMVVHLSFLNSITILVQLECSK